MDARTYRQAAARNVEVGDVIRFGGVNWMRVGRIADELEGRRRAFHDEAGRRILRMDTDDAVHVLDR